MSGRCDVDLEISWVTLQWVLFSWEPMRHWMRRIYTQNRHGGTGHVFLVACMVYFIEEYKLRQSNL